MKAVLLASYSCVFLAYGWIFYDAGKTWRYWPVVDGSTRWLGLEVFGLVVLSAGLAGLIWSVALLAGGGA